MERHIILQAIDTHWQEYLRNMDTLRQGVGLRAYGQRDPLVEYKREAYAMFSDLMDKHQDRTSPRASSARPRPPRRSSRSSRTCRRCTCTTKCHARPGRARRAGCRRGGWSAVGDRPAPRRPCRPR